MDPANPRAGWSDHHLPSSRRRSAGASRVVLRPFDGQSRRRLNDSEPGWMILVTKADDNECWDWNFDLGRSTAEGALTSRSLLERDSAIRWGGLLCLAMRKPRTVFNAASENAASAGILHAPAHAKRGAAGKEAVRSAATSEIRRKLVERVLSEGKWTSRNWVNESKWTSHAESGHPGALAGAMWTSEA